MKRLAVSVAIVLLSSASSVSAEVARCVETGIQVPGWSAMDRDRVCGASAAAIAFLRRIGLEYTDGLTIRPLLPADQPEESRSIGRCNVPGNEILILTYDASIIAAGRYPPAFDMPMSPALWQSFISHEMAHAVVAQNFAVGVRRATASEYIAAVAQLTLLPDELRQAILERYGADGFGSVSEIVMLIYEMNPAVFTVKAYRHYVALGDRGPAFVARLLREGLDQ